MVPHSADRGDKLRFRKTVAAFANSDGGFIVIGIHDDRTLAPEQRMVGCPAEVEVPAQVGSLIASCEPSVDLRVGTPPLRLESGTLVHVVHVPRSKRGPHGIFAEDRWWFPKRGIGGTLPMSYAELRASFTDQRRQRAVAMRLCSEIERIKDTAERLNTAWYHTDLLTVARDCIGSPYRPERIEAAEDALFDQIGSEEYVVKTLNSLVEAAYASDGLCVRFAQAQEAGLLSQALMQNLFREFTTYAIRVMSNANQVLPSLRRLLL